jgi:DNA polymerase elongation subunit (family B)
MFMWKNTKEMTKEELYSQLTDLKKLQKMTADVSVEKLLDKQIDTDVLKRLNVTVTPNGEIFTCDNQGFLSTIMEQMYSDRTKYKKKATEARKELEKETDSFKRFELEKRIARYNNLQLAKKVSLNSAYGALGNEFFRFFDIRQASAITTAGQLSIRWIEKDINLFLNKILGTTNEDYIIASDTDSIYISFAKLVQSSFAKETKNLDKKRVISFLDKVCETKIQPFIDKSYSNLAAYLNVYAQKMQMKREALADRGIWTAKKRYILNVYNNEGVEYKTPKIKVMGLESIKSSTPAACRAKLKESLEIILSGTEDDIIKFIDDFRNEFKQCDVSDIAFPRGVNGLDKYSGSTNDIYAKGTPMHVRGALIYNHWLKQNKLDKVYPSITNGEKIRYIYLKEPNILRSNVIGFPGIIPKELDIRSMIDYNTQYEKSFVEPLKIILDAIGWRTEKRASLEDFFT